MSFRRNLLPALCLLVCSVGLRGQVAGDSASVFDVNEIRVLPSPSEPRRLNFPSAEKPVDFDVSAAGPAVAILVHDAAGAYRVVFWDINAPEKHLEWPVPTGIAPRSIAGCQAMERGAIPVGTGHSKCFSGALMSQKTTRYAPAASWTRMATAGPAAETSKSTGFSALGKFKRRGSEGDGKTRISFTSKTLAESPATWPRNPTEQTSRHNAGSKFLRNDMCFSPGIVPFG